MELQDTYMVLKGIHSGYLCGYLKGNYRVITWDRCVYIQSMYEGTYKIFPEMYECTYMVISE